MLIISPIAILLCWKNCYVSETGTFISEPELSILGKTGTFYFGATFDVFYMLNQI